MLHLSNKLAYWLQAMVAMRAVRPWVFADGRLGR